MKYENRIENEIKHGVFIAKQGEQIWNWSSPAGRKRWKRRINLFSDFLGNKSKSVLEIGCGTGLFTAELVKAHNEITAIDISKDLMDIAEKRVGDKAEFLIRNAYYTNFPNDHFDFIVGSSVLHHLDVEAAITEFYRILKPGGKFMFTEPNMINPQIFLQKNIPFIKKMAGDSPDETAFFRWSIRNKLTAAGFRDVNASPFDFMHPAIPGSLVSKLESIFSLMEKIPFIREFSGSLIISGIKPIIK